MAGDELKEVRELRVEDREEANEDDTEQEDDREEEVPVLPHRMILNDL